MSEELKFNSRSTVIKVALQLFLLVAVVFGWSCWLNNHNDAETTSLDGSTRLPIGIYAANCYPEMTFKSDKKWKKYTQSTDQTISGRLIEGYGNISNDKVSVDCILSENGQLIGRYRNENGITLDVNGYIDSKTDTLYIRLGHDGEQSNLILAPDDNIPTDSIYNYSGTWGKKHKASAMAFSFK